jgi:hypothetical protein
VAVVVMVVVVMMVVMVPLAVLLLVFDYDFAEERLGTRQLHPGLELVT